MVTKTDIGAPRGERYPLKKIPDDVYAILCREQGKLKAKKGQKQFSLGSTIYYIVREFDRMLKERKCPE